MYSEAAFSQLYREPVIPDRKRKHAAEMLHTLCSKFFIGMNDHFRIGMRLESMSSSLEVGSKVLKVVDLTVEYSRHSSVLIANRLPASRHVYDRKAAHPKRHIPLGIDTLVVWAAVGDGSAHAIQHFRIFVTIR
jgi:histidinol phosphatase-like enzyme